MFLPASTQTGGSREGGTMLPDIRAVFAAFLAAIGLMMIAFGAVAAFRVAQESHSGSLQADLATRGQAAPPQSGQRLTVIETPGPHIAPPPPLPVTEVKAAPVGAEVSSIPVVHETMPDVPPVAIAAREAAIVPTAETPIGGPLAEPAAAQSEAEDSRRRKSRAGKEARRRQEGARRAHRAPTQDRGGARRAGAGETAGRDVVIQQWFWKSRLWKPGF